jgi:hypothetical protein
VPESGTQFCGGGGEGSGDGDDVSSGGGVRVGCGDGDDEGGGDEQLLNVIESVALAPAPCRAAAAKMPTTAKILAATPT